MWGELALSFQSGNIYMLAMALLAFMASMLIFERFIMLQFVFNMNFGRFLLNLRKMLTSEDYERAASMCRSASKTGLAKIALKALEAAENDPTTVRGTIEEETLEFLPRLESRLALMPALANVIMLLGILGTIDGLWWAFHSIDVLDTAKKQAALANGVAASLNSTAMGLIVAMLILASHQFLKGVALFILERVHLGVAVLTNLLVPPEVATAYVTAAAADARSGSETAAEQSGGDAAGHHEEGRAGDDGHDEASVDDIKDEEEII